MDRESHRKIDGMGMRQCLPKEGRMTGAAGMMGRLDWINYWNRIKNVIIRHKKEVWDADRERPKEDRDNEFEKSSVGERLKFPGRVRKS